MRILLAEDDRIISQGLIAALRKAGYAVDHVNNGADAVFTLHVNAAPAPTPASPEPNPDSDSDD